MNPPTAPAAALVCEIIAPAAAQASALAAIAGVCARDVGQRLIVRRRTTRLAPFTAGITALVTLHLPAALAAAQHPVWCLACRLACFCPDARVSVHIACASEFITTSRPRRRTSARAA